MYAIRSYYAKQELLTGNMRGYLAFDAGVCVGWCNANDVAQYPRLTEFTEELCRGKRVGCTICFVIHPDYRGKGVAREMLARAIADFRSYNFV